MAEYLPPSIRREHSKRVIPPNLSSETLLSQNFLCSICKNILTKPVCTPCGHNFCKTCLTQHWDKEDRCQCPKCDNTFEKRPDLEVNALLSFMIDEFTKERNATIPAKPGEVPCDVCLEPKQKAVKSCLECYSRLCEFHIQYHSGLRQYETHKLIDVVENIDIYICQKHKKPLELFCTNDHVCVCIFCTEGDHKNHNTVPIEERGNETKTDVKKEQIKVQQLIQDIQKKIQEVHNSAELSKKNSKEIITESVEIFTALRSIIERSQAELLEVMEEKQEAAEKQAEDLIKELEQEITELKRRDTELEKLSHTEDHLHLLQVFPSLCTCPKIKEWTNISTDIHLTVEMVKKALSQLQKTLGAKVYENELKKIKQYKVDVTLDPKTAHASLILSGDGKQVRKGIRPRNLMGSWGVFYPEKNVLGKQGISSGRCYFEVQVKGKTSWGLGVLSPAAGFWTLNLIENVYKAWNISPEPLSLTETPQKVGVFVDYEKGLVSFYDVETSSHIYSFSGQSFAAVLYPYFNPGPHDGGKNSAPLTIIPINDIS